MLKVLHDFILLEPPMEEKTTESGIVLVGTGPETTQRCKVVDVGPGTVNDKGEELKAEVSPGDIVYLPKEVVANAPKHKMDGIEYLFVKQMQILCWEAAE